MTRLLTALVAVPLLLALVLAAPAWTFALVAAGTGLLGYRELGGLARHSGHPPLGAGYLATALLVACFQREVGSWIPFESAVLVSILLLGIAALILRPPARETLGAVAASVFATLYVGALLGTVVGVRNLSPDAAGRRWTVFLLAVVMIGDAGAYYVGRWLGRTRLAPRLSPKKTVEGLLGELGVAILAAVALQTWLLHDVSALEAAGLGLAMSLSAVLGDLFVSLLKRSAGVKDASTLIPGHGGILDRIDSLLFAAPVLYLYRLAGGA